MNMETVNIKINGRDYAVPKGSTVLEAARAANIDIPTLCYLKDITRSVLAASVSLRFPRAEDPSEW